MTYSLLLNHAAGPRHDPVDCNSAKPRQHFLDCTISAVVSPLLVQTEAFPHSLCFFRRLLCFEIPILLVLLVPDRTVGQDWPRRHVL